MALILALDMAGMPNRWLLMEQAITYHARDMVAWSLGDIVCTFRGGVSRITGERSSLSSKSIVAIRGHAEFVRDHMAESHLTNAALYRRDRHICGYCGGHFRDGDLSRDHVVPLHLGGRDRWMNVVTACRSCNHHKARWVHFYKVVKFSKIGLTAPKSLRQFFAALTVLGFCLGPLLKLREFNFRSFSTRFSPGLHILPFA